MPLVFNTINRLVIHHFHSSSSPRVKRAYTMISRRLIRPFSTTPLVWAGHSKWANIRHDKAKNDAKRLKLAYQLATKIETTVRLGGADANASLDTLVEKAKKLSITKKVIELAIKRGLGEITKDGPAVLEVLYEFVGANGMSFVIVANTDNKARTVSLVKNAMGKMGANLSPCMYMFDRKGEVIFDPKQGEEVDDVLEVAIDIGAEDVDEFRDPEYGDAVKFRIITDPLDLHTIANKVSELGYKLQDSRVSYLAQPDSLVEFPEDLEKQFGKAMDELDNIPEIVDYYSNLKE